MMSEPDPKLPLATPSGVIHTGGQTLGELRGKRILIHILTINSLDTNSKATELVLTPPRPFAPNQPPDE